MGIKAAPGKVNIISPAFREAVRRENDVTLVTSFDSYDDSSTAAGALTASGSALLRGLLAGRHRTADRRTGFRRTASPPTPCRRKPTTDTSGLTQVSLTAYNARGEDYCDTDAAGNVTLTTDDDAGRTTQSIKNYSTTIGPDTNIINGTVYNAANLVAETSVTTESGTETTQYVYDCLASSSSPALYCNDEVTAVIYADSTNIYNAATQTFSDGSSGVYDRRKKRCQPRMALPLGSIVLTATACRRGDV